MRALFVGGIYITEASPYLVKVIDQLLVEGVVNLATWKVCDNDIIDR